MKSTVIQNSSKLNLKFEMSYIAKEIESVIKLHNLLIMRVSGTGQSIGALLATSNSIPES